ncbi:hypothetical protein I79_006683 [Cricetulus griseus]|uniref:Uncharacterized protein n=1 Tax=Cricetulus griseus TaxID=10029 RepID=G3H8I2_CRIGR|nr:hypothetical protein I79_006683 [Cricetulus griseus]
MNEVNFAKVLRNWLKTCSVSNSLHSSFPAVTTGKLNTKIRDRCGGVKDEKNKCHEIIAETTWYNSSDSVSLPSPKMGGDISPPDKGLLNEGLLWC